MNLMTDMMLEDLGEVPTPEQTSVATNVAIWGGIGYLLLLGGLAAVMEVKQPGNFRRWARRR